MARLNDVPGIHVDDSYTALPLAGNAYFALFFSMGDGSPGVQLPHGQQFIKWHADVGPDLLAIVLFASLVGHSARPEPTVHPVDARGGQTGW
jgi:hypothetical protein